VSLETLQSKREPNDEFFQNLDSVARARARNSQTFADAVFSLNSASSNVRFRLPVSLQDHLRCL
jgi:hypothetical protein